MLNFMFPVENNNQDRDESNSCGGTEQDSEKGDLGEVDLFS